MRLLWDLRLFSLGYAQRGIGRYTQAVASAAISQAAGLDLVVLGERECVAPYLSLPSGTEWINCAPTNWKHDLLRIAAVVRKHHIDLVHYWVMLGPLYRLGVGAVVPCKTCATVYDLGVERWSDVPFLRAIHQSWYWKVQKALARSVDAAVCISDATRRDLEEVVGALRGKAHVIYPPVIEETIPQAAAREKYFVALGGAPNKNLCRVLCAFSSLVESVSDARLVVLGDIDGECEGVADAHANVTFEGMERYEEHLRRCSGLVFCSTREGLGLPPLEAMRFGCPLLLSDIPVLRETCEGAGLFVDPADVAAIARGMAELLADPDGWSLHSQDAAQSYRARTDNAGQCLLDVYHQVCG